MSEYTEDDLPDPEYWTQELDALQIMIDSANENGLFSNKPDVYKKMVDEIILALKGLQLKKPKVLEARKIWSYVTCEFNQYVNSEKGWWRFKYVYGGPAFVYLISFLASILIIWLVSSPILLNYQIFWVPASAFLWGAVGGILWGIWRLWQHTCAREIRRAWYNWYFALPFVGSILGALVYLALVAGLLAITGEITIQSQFLPMLLSGLAGFSSKWAVELLVNITKMIKLKE